MKYFCKLSTFVWFLKIEFFRDWRDPRSPYPTLILPTTHPHTSLPQALKYCSCFYHPLQVTYKPFILLKYDWAPCVTMWSLQSEADMTQIWGGSCSWLDDFVAGAAAHLPKNCCLSFFLLTEPYFPWDIGQEAMGPGKLDLPILWR